MASLKPKLKENDAWDFIFTRITFLPKEFLLFLAVANPGQLRNRNQFRIRTGADFMISVK